MAAQRGRRSGRNRPPDDAPTEGLPVVAIVGRPNVGKSSLFNRIVGERVAIVEDRERTTRDRIYDVAEWNGRRFIVVDTGGLDAVSAAAGEIEARVQDQARLAIAEAEVIVFVLDVGTGVMSADLEAALLLRRAGTPVIVAVNKADNQALELAAADFHRLGWRDLQAISAIHGRNVADLLDSVVSALPPESADEAERKAVEAADVEPALSAEAEPAWAVDDRPIRLTIVGRPNVGKSSLLNALLGEPRAIVSDIPGTTRDAIDTSLEWAGHRLRLVDTAGIRRPGRVSAGPDAERFATLRALKAVTRSDVAVLVIDALEGLTAQDAHVAGYVLEEGCGLVLALNKWDLVEKSGRTFDEYVARVRRQAPFLAEIPITAISAKTGQRVERVVEAALEVSAERRRRVPTAALNALLREAALGHEPPAVRGRRPRLLYATQVSVEPPTFVFFAAGAAAVHFSYRRFIENQLRAAFGFAGTPMRLIFRERSADSIERRPRPRRRQAARASAAR